MREYVIFGVLHILWLLTMSKLPGDPDWRIVIWVGGLIPVSLLSAKVYKHVKRW